MLETLPLFPVIAASDLKRARAWYEEKLGLVPSKEDPQAVTYECGGSEFYMYESQFAGTAKNTVAEWRVPDIDAAMTEMRSKGVVFEEYDFPGVKTENGVVEMGEGKGAWFKDSEGNILSISQR